MYLVEINGIYNRYVINGPVSKIMDTNQCWNCLQEAIETHGRPEIVNTGQRPQFNYEVFSDFVKGQGTRFSMDGKG